MRQHLTTRQRSTSKSPQKKRQSSSKSLTKVRRSRASGRKAKPSSFPTGKIYGVLVEEADVPEVSESQGPKLQQWVVEQLLSVFKGLTSLDVRSTPMGVNGVDVQLSTAAFTRFSYDIECKNTERMTTLYNYYEQATGHESGGEPLLVIKMNHKKPLAVVDAEHFIRMISCKTK